MSAFVVVAQVSHGEYRQDFYGAGATLDEALDQAAAQSTYSSGIIPAYFGNFRAARVPIRAEVLRKLEAGEPANNFGWVTFRRAA